MSDVLAASSLRSARPRFLRSLGIIGTAVVVGPLVGSAVVLLLMAVTKNIREGTVLAEILKFGSEFRQFILLGYFVGFIPAFGFGTLFSISTFVFGRNSLLVAAAISLLAGVAPMTISHIVQYGLPVPSVKEMVLIVQFGIAPAVVAGIVCWCITRPLHRRP